MMQAYKFFIKFDKNLIIQLTVDGVMTKIGQSVHLIVEVEYKPDTGLVPTQLQLMVA